MLTIVLLALIVIVLLAIYSTLSANNRKVHELTMHVHDSKHGEIPEDIAAMARSGNHLEAKREYRKRTGCSYEIAAAKIDCITAEKRDLSMPW